ncbi:hypothetical protein [Streptomyces sp. NPDC048385]|uniref:hypothetical protein n=1 Tax=unclassified Streptomyces TaxID=2593676 RepID=UPI003431FD69
MTVPTLPGLLVLAALGCLAFGLLSFAAAGLLVLRKVLVSGRPTQSPLTAWTVERLSPASGQWGKWGGPYATESEAFEDFTDTIADPLRDSVSFRVVEISTTYRLRALRSPKNRATA